MSDSIERLIRQLQNTYHGPSWHGPTLKELLADVTAGQAEKKGIRNAHSIWEIVLHAAAWKRAVERRLEGAATSLQGEEDWPPVEHSSESAWRTALDDLDTAHDALVGRVRQLAPTELDRFAPAQKVSLYATIHGVIQHDIYHAGQIALLKKL
ncbi:MAG: DinB family protein [Gemmatimonadota bacterium]